MSVRNSLKNLRTDYIDILYVHAWDYSTAPRSRSSCKSLNHLVAQGEGPVSGYQRHAGVGGHHKANTIRSIRSPTTPPTETETDSVRTSPLTLLGHEAQVSAVLDVVALAYAMQKTPYFFPVVGGGRKVEHLRANVEALSLELTPPPPGRM
ncbi:hypothetical protein BO70DRAFT_376695 [Aspergillus heteromorphus CBS 117.55]|uniref:NADP-dependent oxidoreductase domain-containing protein n=1 Tax=Aspergillus heteromorphus CBS 117.55 TaxID=1448321 RepID=A0A317WZW8_9EURO|nr:uncharacterized protein BO70DRAFT_376695 [Aspergillus heteromorphus CBS 117.55]PWY90872.1 hypothetical protein BO70DRAFT_376695 [Aspergillus heteromorphus CBS 117.55]